MGLVWALHLALMVFILFGWAILPAWTLKYQMLVVPLIFLDWNDHDGQCFLTRIEHFIKTGAWAQTPAEEEGGPEFFRPVLESITGEPISRLAASRVNYAIFIAAWLMTYYQFYQHQCA